MGTLAQRLRALRPALEPLAVYAAAGWLSRAAPLLVTGASSEQAVRVLVWAVAAAWLARGWWRARRASTPLGTAVWAIALVLSLGGLTRSTLLATYFGWLSETLGFSPRGLGLLFLASSTPFLLLLAAACAPLARGPRRSLALGVAVYMVIAYVPGGDPLAWWVPSPAPTGYAVYQAFQAAVYALVLVGTAHAVLTFAARSPQGQRRTIGLLVTLACAGTLSAGASILFIGATDRLDWGFLLSTPLSVANVAFYGSIVYGLAHVLARLRRPPQPAPEGTP
jgi:hypothetical protein